MFVLWLFVLTPLVRRLIDLNLGWADPNIVLLAPYVASVWSVLAFPSVMYDRHLPLRWPLIGAIMTILYAWVAAFLQVRVLSGTLSALIWLTPPCLAALVLITEETQERLHRHLELFFVLALIGTASYGIYQFTVVPMWDVVWMNNVEMGSIGRPLPFELRVFSTMNAPGPFAYFVVTGLLFALVARGPLGPVALVLGTVALSLTMVRSAWVAVALGLVVVLVRGRMLVRVRLMAGIGAALVVGAALTAHPDIGPTLTARLTSLGTLSQDTSAIERLRNYEALAEAADDRILGRGLAVAEVYTEPTGQERAIDSGVIEIILGFGVPAGAIYLGCVALIVWRAVAVRFEDGRLVGPSAAATALFASILAGSATKGVVGVFLWLSTALVLISLRAPSTRRRPAGPQRSDNTPPAVH